jgi:carbon-monoxide dehydrogenase small subunit
MLVTAAELIAKQQLFTREQIRDFLSGNYCRCTGYQAIVDAIEQVLKARAKDKRL